MSTTLGFSEINHTEETNKPQGRKNQTRRRNRNSGLLSKAQTFLNSMKKPDDSDDDTDEDKVNKNVGVNLPEEGGSGLADFVPNPVLTRTPDEAAPINPPGNDLRGGNDNAVDPESFKLLNQGELDAKYYKQFVMPKMDQHHSQYRPYYNSLQKGNSQMGSVSDPNELMKKLNYMIHLLEEQQDEKTENVTEELILYLFLGVFVIFVVDSFARAGKYTR
jgi:hypothetical protein